MGSMADLHAQTITSSSLTADSNAVSLGRFCKLVVPDPITVTTGAARVVFEGRVNSRRPPSRKGVRVNYEILGETLGIQLSLPSMHKCMSYNS